MRRTILAAVLIALLAATGALASGCGKGAAAVGAIDNAAASTSPGPWAKMIELGGSLSGAQRGRSNVTVALTGTALRFDLTYGSAPGWGADHARVHWWLYPVTDGAVPQPAVQLRVVSKTYQHENDSTTLRLETVRPLAAGSYELLYQGSGSYSMVVYQR